VCTSSSTRALVTRRMWSISVMAAPLLSIHLWLGWLIESDRRLAFVIDRDQDRQELVCQCLDVGLEHLVGGLGSIGAWTGTGREVASIPLVDRAHMTDRVVDIRQSNEYAAGHVPGAINVELWQVRDAGLPEGPLTVMCGHGERAMTGASLLAACGPTDVVAGRAVPVFELVQAALQASGSAGQRAGRNALPRPPTQLRRDAHRPGGPSQSKALLRCWIA
jgi:rhodanese-related sulfurtransferase